VDSLDSDLQTDERVQMRKRLVLFALAATLAGTLGCLSHVRDEPDVRVCVFPGDPSYSRLFVGIDEVGRCLVITDGEVGADTHPITAQAYAEPCEELGWIDDMGTSARGTWPAGVISWADGTMGLGEDGIYR
jgi:hypothetical protein